MKILIKKLLIINLLTVSVSLFAQNTDLLKTIDSISQKRWDLEALDLDSLANPQFQKVESGFKDTIVVRDEILLPALPEELPVTPYNMVKGTAKKWFYYGQNNLLFNQSSFDHWISGGNNNIGVIGKIHYNLLYKNRKHYLENSIQLGYGFIISEGESSRKTEDYINLMTNYGYELGSNYYLSSGIQFVSQFSAGYNYSATPDPGFSDRVSRFMAPGYLNVGLGISYNPEENFQIIFRPVNGKFTFVSDPFLQKQGKFGLDHDGQKVRNELGAMLNIIYRLKIVKGVNFDNQLNFFSNYLDHPERVDIAYNGVLNIKFNKFISTVLSLDLVYDHDQIRRLQRKQTLAAGISYNFGQNAESERPKKIIKPFISQ